MATVAEKFNHTAKMIVSGINWSQVRIALIDSSYVFDATDVQFSELSTAEIVGTGYVAGGKNVPVTASTVNGDELMLDAADITWAGLTATFRRAVLYVSGTVDGVVNPLLLAYLLNDAPADIVVTDTDYTLVIDPNGLIAGAWV